MSHRRHFILWVLAGMFALVAFTSWAPAHMLARSVRGQIGITRSWLGNSLTNSVVSGTNTITAPLVKWAKSAGAYQHGSGENSPVRRVLGKGGGKVYAKFVWRGTLLLYGFVFRLLIILIWLAPAFFLLGWLVLDGTRKRIVKMETFAYSSPVILQGSLHAVIFMLGLPFLYLFLPFPLPPVFPLFFLIGAGFAARQAIAQVPKIT